MCCDDGSGSNSATKSPTKGGTTASADSPSRDTTSGIDPDMVVLQFGRVGKHKFALDVSWPLSPLQAFCICVASLDGKIADRKGYEFLKNTSKYLFGSKE